MALEMPAFGPMPLTRQRGPFVFPSRVKRHIDLDSFIWKQLESRPERPRPHFHRLLPILPKSEATYPSSVERTVQMASLRRQEQPSSIDGLRLGRTTWDLEAHPPNTNLNATI